MVRPALIAVLGLFVTGVFTVGCTNGLDDAGSGDPQYITPSHHDTKGGSSDDSNIQGSPSTPDKGSNDDAGGGSTATSGSVDDQDAGAPAPADPGADPGTPQDPPPDPAPAPDPVPAGSFAAGTQLETTANLNMRDGEGTDFAIITTIPKDSIVTVQTTSGASGWVYVSYDGYVGYCSKSYLTAAP